MSSMSVNQLAKSNGDFGEDVAQVLLNRLFSNCERVNDLLDFYLDNGIPIEIKTCQEWINRCDRPSLRHGRFKLEKDQHEVLLVKKGYYLFLVKSGDFIVKGKLVMAEDITFFKQVTWHGLV